MTNLTEQHACPCLSDPLSSDCGEWDGNVSLCACADLGLAGQAPG